MVELKGAPPLLKGLSRAETILQKHREWLVDPERWVPEAARLLRPGGRLITLTNSVLAVLAMPDLEEDGPATDRLLRPQRSGRLQRLNRQRCR